MAETIVNLEHVAKNRGRITFYTGRYFHFGQTMPVPLREFDFDKLLCDELAGYVEKGWVKATIRGVSQSPSVIRSWKARYIDPGVHPYTDFQASVADRYDPSGGLPANPESGVRYISTGTGYGWLPNRIYVWNSHTSVWEEIVPTEGTNAWVEDENAPYIFDGNAWQIAAGPPSPHTHVEVDITDLDHDAVKIQGVDVEAVAPADGNALVYNQANNRWEPGVAPGSNWGRFQARTTSTFNLNVTTAVNIPWNVEEFKDSFFTHDNIINPQDIVITTDGNYTISWKVFYQNFSFNAKNIVAGLYINGVPLAQTFSVSYAENTIDKYGCSSLSPYEIAFSATDVLNIRVFGAGSTGNANLVADTSWVRLVRVN